MKYLLVHPSRADDEYNPILILQSRRLKIQAYRQTPMHTTLDHIGLAMGQLLARPLQDGGYKYSTVDSRAWTTLSDQKALGNMVIYRSYTHMSEKLP